MAGGISKPANVKDLLLLSGGMDSAALAAWVNPYRALVIDYGQLCAPAELRAARAICQALRVPLDEIRVDASAVGSGDLSGRAALNVSPAPEWWPFRNQLLVTIGAAHGLAVGAKRVLVGTVRSDEFHADGTPAFFSLLSELLANQEGEMTVSAPAIHLSTAELISQARISHETMAWAHSCHRSSVPCGVCRGCTKRSMVLQELGWA